MLFFIRICIFIFFDAMPGCVISLLSLMRRLRCFWCWLMISRYDDAIYYFIIIYYAVFALCFSFRHCWCHDVSPFSPLSLICRFDAMPFLIAFFALFFFLFWCHLLCCWLFIFISSFSLFLLIDIFRFFSMRYFLSFRHWLFSMLPYFTLIIFALMLIFADYFLMIIWCCFFFMLPFLSLRCFHWYYADDFLYFRRFRRRWCFLLCFLMPLFACCRFSCRRHDVFIIALIIFFDADADWCFISTIAFADFLHFWFHFSDIYAICANIDFISFIYFRLFHLFSLYFLMLIFFCHYFLMPPFDFRFLWLFFFSAIYDFRFSLILIDDIIICHLFSLFFFFIFIIFCYYAMLLMRWARLLLL